MNKRFVFPTPLSAQVAFSADNGEVRPAAPDTHPSGRVGQSYDIAGLPNGNGGRLVGAALGYLPYGERGTLYTDRPGGLFDVDDFTLTLDPFAPAPEVLPIHQDGLDARTSDGKRYTQKHATNYLAFQRFLEGGWDAVPRYPGFEGDNVTFLMSVVPAQAGLRPLRPENYPNYFQRAEEFLDGWQNIYHRRLEATLICDGRQLGIDHNYQVNFTNQMYPIFQKYAHTVQLANEPDANDVDYSSFIQPAGIFWSRGSSLSGYPCPLPPGNYSTAHLGRGGPGGQLDAQPLYMQLGYGASGSNAAYAGVGSRRVAVNESKGATDGPETGSRTRDLWYFYQCACAERGYMGGTFHFDIGIHSDFLPPGCNQDLSRIAYLAGAYGQMWG